MHLQAYKVICFCYIVKTGLSNWTPEATRAGVARRRVRGDVACVAGGFMRVLSGGAAKTSGEAARFHGSAFVFIECPQNRQLHRLVAMYYGG